MLYSLRSAWTSLARAHIARIAPRASAYAAAALDRDSRASLSRGAALFPPSLPSETNSIASTCERRQTTAGARTPAAASRARLRASFSAQALTILRALPLQ